MNVTVKEFIESNGNNNLKWEIDGMLFDHNIFIYSYLLERHVNSWVVSQWDGIIKIATDYQC